MSSLPISEYDSLVSQLINLGKRILCKEENHNRESLQWAIETETGLSGRAVEAALDVLLGEIESEKERENGQDVQGDEYKEKVQGGKGR